MYDSVGALCGFITSLPQPWLIGVDVDGTLAPIVSRPSESELAPGAREALDTLAQHAGVIVTVVSGRPLADLRHLFELPPSVILIGSHGAEVGREAPTRTPAEERLIESAANTFHEAARDLPGAWIEHKPLSVALHVRQADRARALSVLAALEPALDGHNGITLHRGKMVLEAAVRPTSKTDAFGRVRQRLEPSTSIFIGDDGSDEDVFRSLADRDVAVKVGGGPTFANHRLAAPTDVVELLAGLAARRRY